MAADLLILVGSSAPASIITRTLPEDEAPAFRSAGFVGLGSHHYYVPVEAQQDSRVGPGAACRIARPDPRAEDQPLCAAHGRADRG